MYTHFFLKRLYFLESSTPSSPKTEGVIYFLTSLVSRLSFYSWLQKHISEKFLKNEDLQQIFWRGQLPQCTRIVWRPAYGE